jgi:hypothetical protein
MYEKLEHAIALPQFGRFAPLHGRALILYACVLVLLVLVAWLFVALKKGRAAAARRSSEESTRPAEGSPTSDERRAFLIKLEQKFEGLKGGGVHRGTPETAASQTNFGDFVHSATQNGEPDLKAGLDRAEVDLRAALPAEDSPLSDEGRAFLIKLEQEFEGLKGRGVYSGTPETATSQTSFGDFAHSAAYNGEPDLKAALDRAEADLRAMKALLAEVSVDRNDMRLQRDDALRERDDWRSQAEEWKEQAARLILTLPAARSAAERPTLTLPAPRPTPPGTTFEPPSRPSWWPWRRRAG